MYNNLCTIIWSFHVQYYWRPNYSIQLNNRNIVRTLYIVQVLQVVLQSSYFPFFKKYATCFMHVRILKIEKEDLIVTQKPSRWQVQISVLGIFQLKKTNCKVNLSKWFNGMGSFQSFWSAFVLLWQSLVQLVNQWLSTSFYTKLQKDQWTQWFCWTRWACYLLAWSPNSWPLPPW